MSKHTALKKCVAVLLSAVLLSVGTIRVWAADDLSQLRETQEQLEAQKEENDRELELLREDVDQKSAYRDALYGQIDTVQNQLDLLREQIDGLNDEISQKEDGIAEKQAAIGEGMDLFKERIRALYVAGDATTISFLLDSTSLMDFSRKAQVMKAITRHDQEMIEELTGQLEEIQEELDSINLDKQELSRQKKDMEAKSAELTELYEEAQELVAQAENDAWTVKANSELLGSQLEENEQAIARLEEELGQQASLSGAGYVGTGSFIWPMPGYTYLTCYFGEGGHRGIDVAGGEIYGKPIVAADGGTVTYAGWNDSYGYCVFIDHGNGYETRYAHMSALNISTGSRAEQGAVIGYVGSTGNSTGPHLHFEVIYGGSLTNPMSYF